jgi:hypothetical protein
MSTEPENLRLGLIVVSAKGIAEMDRHRPVVFIPRDKLVRLTIAHASAAEQPLVVLAISIIALAVSVYPIIVLLNRLAYGGVLSGKLFLLCAFFPLAPWLIRLALKRRNILVAHTSNGSRKLLIGDTVPPVEIEPFVTRAASVLGCTFAVAPSFGERAPSGHEQA